MARVGMRAGDPMAQKGLAPEKSRGTDGEGLRCQDNALWRVEGR